MIFLEKTVGIVLPIYNQKPEYIYECLESIEIQDYPHLKLVIVIDGANDLTREALFNALNNFTRPFQIIDRSDNRGIAYSLNEGFDKILDCDYLTWISSDNRHYPFFISTLVNHIILQNENVVLVHSLFDIINENGERLNQNQDLMANFMHRPKKQITQNCFIGASFLYKTSAYRLAGPYDTTFENVEDYEFWMRLLDVGDKVFIAEPLLEYRVNNEYSVTYKTTHEVISIKSAYASIHHRKKINDIPKVSVIITAYNLENYIINTIKSVLNQTYYNFQIIVVNDASLDSTWEKINSIFDSRIIPINLNNNRGKVACLNLALEFSLGEYIMELDGDDWIEPNTLEAFVFEMDNLPADVGLAYGNRRIWYAKEGILQQGQIYKGLHYYNKYEVLTKMQTHCPRFFRKSALESIGGWPTDLVDNDILLPDDFAIMVLLSDQYKFHWIDKLFYNQVRHKSNITHQHIKCNNQLEEIVRKTLIKWGNEFTPIFHYEDNWIMQVELVPNN